MIDRRLLFSWIKLTWLGWLLGIPIIIGLALIGETVGIGGSQTLVGVGMGIGIGLMQGRIIRNLIQKPILWLCSSAIGLGAPFLMVDISHFTGWSIPYSLPLLMGIGGVITGSWQFLILRPYFRRSQLWIAASFLGCALAAGTSDAADSLVRSQTVRGIWGAVLYLGIVASGGLIPGLITGICLAWMPRREEFVKAPAEI